MLDAIKKRKDSGFTIVEVMIVLAIAGLIILVVFLAVPALQRNSRNTQRNSDASLVGGAVNECLTNRNGQQAKCNNPTDATNLGQYIDTSKLRQFTVVNVSTTPPSATPGSENFTDINIAYGRKCDAAGSAAITGPARSIALLFNTENQSGGAVTRCVDV